MPIRLYANFNIFKRFVGSSDIQLHFKVEYVKIISTEETGIHISNKHTLCNSLTIFITDIVREFYNYFNNVPPVNK